MAVNELQNKWDAQLPHLKFTHKKPVSTAMGLASNGFHMGRLPRPPLTIIERTGIVGLQSLARDYLAYCDLATDRQKRVCDIVREHHVLTVARVNRHNSALCKQCVQPPNSPLAGGRGCTIRRLLSIRRGAKTDTGAKVHKANLSPDWTGPYKVFVRHLYLDGLSRNKTGKIAGRGTVMTAASTSPDPSATICHNCGKAEHYRNGCTVPAKAHGQEKKPGSGGSAGKNWWSAHKTTTHNDAECYAERVSRPQASSKHTAAAMGAQPRPDDTKNIPFVNIDDDFDTGFAF